VNAEQIRAAFFHDHLNRARTQSHSSQTARLARELRRYFNWCANSLTAKHRQSIAEQLSHLESDLKQRG
jgi:hypothetical protein